VASLPQGVLERPRFRSLDLVNFLSYRKSSLEFDDFIALVGPNASGKSNAVAAIKLLRDIPFHGLPIAIARRGGFDQLRHRSHGRPYDPALKLRFSYDGNESYYELALGAIAGKRYEVKHEHGVVKMGLDEYRFTNDSGKFSWTFIREGAELDIANRDRQLPIPPGQSAVTASGNVAAYWVSRALQSMQTVAINPALVSDLQEPSSTREFEPDGSNAASIYDALDAPARTQLVDEMSAIVPGIVRIDVRRLADKVTLEFVQDTGRGNREFLAKQMSDGTLRVFGMLLSTLQGNRPSLVVIEEPEIAMHLGALHTLVDVLKQQAMDCQVVITTHSADIVDILPIESLRVVWNVDGASHLAEVADHTRETVKRGLITPGALLRADSLDPVGA